MRYMLAFVMVFAATLQSNADDAALKKILKSEVEKIQAAGLKGDFEYVLDRTYPKLVEIMGGKEKALPALLTAMKAMKAKGIEMKAAKAGEPSDPVRGGTELYCVIPTTTEMSSPKGKAISKGYMIGISSDEGKTWRFVHGSLDSEKVRKLLPGLPEKLVLPKREIKFVDE